MGDSVERALEETVPILRTAQRLKLLTAAETAEVVRKRRNHEYAVLSHKATRATFLRYAAFERELSTVLSTRAKKRGLKKKKEQLVVGRSSARVNLVYSRAVRRFPGDPDLWLHYAKHCIRTGSTRAAARVFAKALGFCGGAESVWLAAVAFQFDTCGDATSARAIAQRALRALPGSVAVWREYFRMEVCYLAKLVSRRVAMGLPTVGSKKRKMKNESAKQPKKRHRRNRRPSKPDRGDTDGEIILEGDAQGKGKLRKDESGRSGDEEEALGDSGREDLVDADEDDGSDEDRAENDDESKAENIGGNEHIAGGGDGDVLELPEADKLDVSKGRNSTTDNAQNDEGLSDAGNAIPVYVDVASNAEEQSDAGTSSSEEEQEVDEEESTVEGKLLHHRQKRLTFWEGGVPLAVFYSASERVKLTSRNRTEFWDIAASTPYVPTSLLVELSHALSKSYPDCLACKLLQIRLPWDQEHASYIVETGRQGGKAEESEAQERFSKKVEGQRKDLEARALEVLKQVEQALRNVKGPLGDAESNGVLFLITSFRNVCTPFDKSGGVCCAADALNSLVRNGLQNEAQEETVDKFLTGEDFSQLSTGEVLKLLNREGGLSSEHRSHLYDAFKAVVLVPFRNCDQDRAVSSWISEEDDLDRLRDLSTQLLALPPVTMESLRSLINAEIRIWRESDECGPAIAQARQEMVSRTRALFEKAISLPAAKRDIDLWVEYLDFERRISQDAKQATMVSWKASKALDEKNGDVFVERQTLRNLV